MRCRSRGPRAPGSVFRHLAPRGTEELQQVVAKAHEAPLASDLAQSPERETAEASCRLDLAEDGFGDGLAPRVDAASLWGGKTGLHLRSHVRRGRRRVLRSRGAAVTIPTGCDVGLDSRHLAVPDVGGGEVAGIGGEHHCPIAGLDQRIDHRRKVLYIGRLVAYALRDDDLMLRIHEQLTVVGLFEGSVADHDPALWVGEVSLRGCFRFAVARGRDLVQGQSPCCATLGLIGIVIRSCGFGAWQRIGLLLSASRMNWSGSGRRM